MDVLALQDGTVQTQRKANVYNSPYLQYFVDKKFNLSDQILVTRTDPSMCFTEYHDSETGKESKFVVVTRDSEGLLKMIKSRSTF